MPIGEIEIAIEVAVAIAIHVAILIDDFHENGTKLGLMLRIGVDEIDGVDLAVAVGIELEPFALRQTLDLGDGGGIEGGDLFAEDAAEQYLLVSALRRSKGWGCGGPQWSESGKRENDQRILSH